MIAQSTGRAAGLRQCAGPAGKRQPIFSVVMMKTAVLATSLVMLLGFGHSVAAHDDHHHHEWRRWWGDERKEEFWDGPCEVKIESKRGEYKREVKCKDGIGARWRGEWKEEFRDGRCRVKQEAKRDEFKEEVKCDD
ncbi:hypothetical protein V2S84_14435 [Azotobacter chroococcum]|nr:hypothetical protein [Azotobacter chroococcum]